MKTRILYLSFILCCSPVIVLAQTKEKNNAETESLRTLIPVEKPLFLSAGDIKPETPEKLNLIWSVKPVSIGTYSYGYILNNDYPWMRNYGISLALFPAGSVSSFNNPLTEFIPYEINTAKQGEFRGSEISTYWDPGITVFSPNRKFSVDLYKRSSTQIIFNGAGKTTPFLLNLHF